jgi:hypothetical protein
MTDDTELSRSLPDALRRFIDLAEVWISGRGQGAEPPGLPTDVLPELILDSFNTLVYVLENWSSRTSYTNPLMLSGS